MSFGHVLLGLLADGERHGYDLKRQYTIRFPAARPLAAAQIYAALERLVRDGFVVPAGRERVSGPDRTSYAVTPTGRAELDRWLADVEPPGPFVSNPLAIKVTLALLVADADTAASYLNRQRAAHLEQMREHTRAKTEPGAPIAAVLAADYALNHLNADLRWIDTALARVAALAEETHR